MNNFYSRKKVLVTGHTGFKGTWLCQILKEFGADVIGYALKPPTEPSLFVLTAMDRDMSAHNGDIRDRESLRRIFEKEQPEIVIHMAAQPLVRESYANPADTYETNVMGTVNLLDCIRLTPTVKSVVNVTTDKVYRNNEWKRGYVETDVLDGYDPYSNSKSCSELVTHSYVQAFLKAQGVAVSTCRAGNVIGGGDFAKDRIIPDCVRAAEQLVRQCGGTTEGDIVVRNPHSIRPYQHVLEPLFAYLMVALEQYERPELSNCYNVGPEDDNCVTTGELVDLFCKLWNAEMDSEGYEQLGWIDQFDGGPHEANFLKLDCTKLKQTFGWKPKWSIEKTLEQVVEFEQLRILTSDKKNNLESVLCNCMHRQIEEYRKA
ncbi:MAG: CDP-glucose 4,6-dehydratase [Lachnospiraceae bacterium]